MTLASNVTAPAITGEATLVPPSRRHPPLVLEPRKPALKETISGFTRPYPFGNSHVVIPLEEKDAISK